MLCQICKKNPAVIFMNKLEGGKTTRLALCLACAHKQGMQLKELFSQSGMTDEQAEAMNKQIADMMQDLKAAGYRLVVLSNKDDPDVASVLNHYFDETCPRNLPQKILRALPRTQKKTHCSINAVPKKYPI